MLVVVYCTSESDEGKDMTDHVLQYYFVAHLDVLGQSSELLKLIKLPGNDQEKNVAVRTLRNTAGRISNLRRNFVDMFEQVKRPTGTLDSLSKEDRVEAEEIRRIEHRISVLSDAVVVSVPIDDGDEHCLGVTSIWVALYGICGLFVAALACQYAFRCGVEVGLAVPLNEHEIYGPCLVKAHALESRVAGYPRVVVGDSLFDYLLRVQKMNSTGLRGRFAKQYAGNCLGLITEDHDGIRILDVIGEAVRKEEGGVCKEWVEKAYAYVVRSHEDWATADDCKMRARYGALRNYFESRMALWDISIVGKKG